MGFLVFLAKKFIVSDKLQKKKGFRARSCSNPPKTPLCVCVCVCVVYIKKLVL
jgi:hypothetical protein